MTEEQKQEIINELKAYIDSILGPIDNELLFPLKDLMGDYNITRERLAHEMGVDRETVSKWLLNEQRITDEQVEQLHKFFEYQLELDH